MIDAIRGTQATPVLVSRAIFSFAGRDENGDLAVRHRTGADEERQPDRRDIVAGSLDAVDVNPSSIIIGRALARKLNLEMGDTVSVVSPAGNVRAMKIVGLFETGNASYDEGQTFAQLTRVQALMNRPNVANLIVIRMARRVRNAPQPPSSNARHRLQVGVTAGKASRDLLDALVIPQYHHVHRGRRDPAGRLLRHLQRDLDRGTGETRDIAILKSMGFHARHPPDLRDRGRGDRHRQGTCSAWRWAAA